MVLRVWNCILKFLSTKFWRKNKVREEGLCALIIRNMAQVVSPHTNNTPITPSVELSTYRDQHFKGSRADQEHLLSVSATIYVGNLSFYTTEEQIYELFSKCGDIKRIIMGLDKYKKTPCGFCFVEYYQRMDADACMRFINGTRLDDRIIRTDWDAGFIEGRQYGRGKSGGQVRDEYRKDYDGGRGGYGKNLQQEASINQAMNIFGGQ